MAVSITTRVRYATSGMEYWEPAMVDKLSVCKTDEDTVLFEFQKAEALRGSMTIPNSIATVLARALLIVAEGYAPQIDAKLP
jgi:hypothetical protein